MPADRRRLYLPSDVTFRQVTREDYRFLYDLLVERYESEYVNIPGKARPELPTYEEHVAHLDRGPYARCDVIVAAGLDIGMLYLTAENVAGCFVLEAYHGRGAGLAACYNLSLESDKPLYTNVNPVNRIGCKTLERLGFERMEERPEIVAWVLRGEPLNPFARFTGRGG